ncbi:hypothetical protein AYI69_g11495, partial [Smittium culicis]
MSTTDSINVVESLNFLDNITSKIFSDPLISGLYMQKFICDTKRLSIEAKNSNGQIREEWPECVKKFHDHLKLLQIDHLTRLIQVEPDYYSWDL